MYAKQLSALVFSALFLSLSAVAQNESFPRNLDSHLQELIRQRSLLGAQAAARVVGLPATDSDDRVRVKVKLTGSKSAEDVGSVFKAAGSSVEAIPVLPREMGPVLELVADVPVGQLVSLASTPGVQAILVWYAPRITGPHVPLKIEPTPYIQPRVTYPGQVVSQAATPIGITALLAQASTLTGAGNTIAIISDSFAMCSSCSTTSATDIGANNLPGAGNPAGNTTPVVVVTDAAGADEGRAMIQSDYALAPQAKYCFATAGVSETTFAAAILALAKPLAQGGTCGANVVIDDIGFPSEPFFSDGIVAGGANTVFAAGVTYLSSAGNVRGLYDGTWNPVSDTTVRGASAGTYGNLKFSTVPTSATAGGYHNFSSTGTQISFSVSTKKLQLVLEWNDPFVAANITSDYNILVFDASGNYLPALSATTTNASTGEPVEISQLPTTTSTTTYQIVLAAATTPGAAKRLRIIPDKDTDTYTTTLPSAGEYPAIYGHPGANGAIGTAAYSYADLTTPQSFSSGGPFVNYFDASGNRLSTPEIRQKPLLAGIDNVNTSFFGSDTDGDGIPNFTGTSAAAPTAGAVAALVLQASGFSATPTQVMNYMAQSASHNSLWAPKDGFGYVNALKAANLARNINSQAASTTVLTASANPALVGSSVTLTATVGGSASTHTGNVNFFDGTVSIGSAVVTSNVATLTTSALALGSHSLTANYTGDNNNLQSSGSLTETISGPVFAVTGYPNPAHIATANNVTVTAKDPSGNTLTTFTGTVTLTSTDPAATLPAAYTYTTGDNGVHIFSVTLATSGSQTITATSGTSAGSQTGIIVDNNLWLHFSDRTLARLSESGTTGVTTTAGANNVSLHSVAFDSSGLLWDINTFSNGITKHNATTGVATATYTGAGVTTPKSIAIDGKGQIWVTSAVNRINVFTNAGVAVSPSTGYLGATSSAASPLTSPTVISIDPSGSLWIANSGSTVVTKVFGVAAPTVAPLSTAAGTNTLGAKP